MIRRRMSRQPIRIFTSRRGLDNLQIHVSKSQDRILNAHCHMMQMVGKNKAKIWQKETNANGESIIYLALLLEYELDVLRLALLRNTNGH